MNRRSWIIGGMVLVAVVVLVLILLRPGGPERPATIVETVKEVDAHPRPKDDWRPAAVDMAIYGGGQVRTGAASSARLELLEGIVRLSADTVFTVKESASRQGTLLTTLFLQEGRLWAHLTSAEFHEFAVETGSAVAAVRDTHFSVRVSDGETLVSVAEGAVELTAQEQGVTVAAGQQATVDPNRPPGKPEPMSEEELILWATEGERPGLAPPAKIHGDVSCRLIGRADDLAARNPETVFDVTVESKSAARVAVETPDRGTIILEPFGDLFGMERRFYGFIQGLPQAGGTYTFTALTAEDTPIPGAEVEDVYVGGYEPDPPANVRAEVVADIDPASEDGILVSWDPSPVIPGGFDPGGSPPRGFYQIMLSGEDGMAFGWSHPGRPLGETSHLIPRRRQDFGPGDRGMALEEMEDGDYSLIVAAFSWAPDGATAGANECSALPGEDIRVVIRGGQVDVVGP